ncbi:hypothetical protein NEPAR07_2129 [Nematocida parisii]|nr:hypothetical protein NEPAR07_2129 [Nematocida parisii]
MPESVYVRRIQELLAEICESSLLLMPPNKLSTHPCDWLSGDMENILSAIELTKDKVNKDVQQKKEIISAMEIRKNELQQALEEVSDQESTLWIYEKNLTVKESLLEKEVNSLSVRYENQLKEFAGVSSAIKEAMTDLDEHMVYENECNEILNICIVTKPSICQAKDLLDRLKRKQEEIKEETQKKIENTKDLLISIGVNPSAYPTTSDIVNALSVLEEQLENISSETQSYNYTVSKIDISAEKSADSSSSTCELATSGVSSSVKPAGHELTVVLKRPSEIVFNNLIVDGLILFPFNFKGVPETNNLFPFLDTLSFSGIKKIELNLVKINQLAKELDMLFTSRIVFLSSKIHPQGKESIDEISIIRKIIIEKAWIQQMEEEYKKKINEIFTEKKGALQTILNDLERIQEKKHETIPFPSTIDTLKFTEQEQIIYELEEKTLSAQTEYEILKNIEAFSQERKELLQKMSAFEEQASDPLRLFRSSFQLNSEEKFRKMAVPTLLRVEKEIFALASEYAEKFSDKPIVLNKKEIITELKNEISNRIINANTFMKGRVAKPNK